MVYRNAVLQHLFITIMKKTPEESEKACDEPVAPQKIFEYSEPVIDIEKEDKAFLLSLSETNTKEGDEALARGDKLSAIFHYRQALGIHPTAELYLKIAEVLSTEVTTQHEALELLKKAESLYPDNKEIAIKIARLEPAKPKEQPSIPNAPSQPPKKAFVYTPPSEEQFPTKTLREKVALILLFIVMIGCGAVIYYNQHYAYYTVIVTPPRDSVMERQQIEMKWVSNADFFRLEVMDGKKKVLDIKTIDKKYVPNSSEQKMFLPGRDYTWRISPLDDYGNAVTHMTVESRFSVKESIKLD